MYKSKLEQGADRGIPVRNRTGCRYGDNMGHRIGGTSGKKNRMQTVGNQWGIEQDANRGTPVGNRIRCIQWGTSGE